MAFNWTQLVLEKAVENFDSHSKLGAAMTASATLVVVAVVTIALGFLARAQLGTGEGAVVPAGRLSARGFLEFLIEYIDNLAASVIGKEGKTYVPMFTAIFLFILLNNLVGVIPGMTPATENLNTTLAFGVFTFIAYNFLGIRKQGFANYMKHFMGPIIFLAPLMFIIEMISHLVRPLSLGLRLANVVTGDHLVLSIFTGLAPALVPIPFYMLGLFVAVVQAFVFTLLSMVYVALAVAHSDHHH
jgi:F-type H+-transporting ATPase subunit a